MYNYWTATQDTQQALGGRNPACPNCGSEMYPIDDHGRFRCPKGDDPDSIMEKIMREIRTKKPQGA